MDSGLLWGRKACGSGEGGKWWGRPPYLGNGEDRQPRRGKKSKMKEWKAATRPTASAGPGD